MAASICSGAVPELAASTIERAGLVTAMPARRVTSAPDGALVVVCSAIPGRARTPRASRGTVRWTRSGITVCQDMSESYLAGALEHLPEAESTFDRFDIKAQRTKAVDEVRRAERVEHGELLRHTRYLWLRTPRNLTDRQAERLQGLLRLPLSDRTRLPLDAALRRRL